MNRQRPFVWLLALILLGASACTGHMFPTTGARAQSSVPPAAKPARENASPPLASARVSPEAKYLTHTVQGPGETFAVMARWYTGRSANWTRLAKANPGIDPRRIQIGDTIRIPDEIVTNRRSMPKAVPSAPVAKKASGPAPRTGTELFGPVETPPPEVELFAPIEETPPGAGNPANEISTPALEALE